MFDSKVRPAYDYQSRNNAVRKQTIHEEDWEAPQPDRPRNVVVFGECGVGKSSLINLLAGKRVCNTSSGALGCTLEYKQYELNLGDESFAVWDTAGLDEGSHGSVPAEKAEVYLKQLLHALSVSGGVDLLVYCVRGARVRSALLTNYHIFYSAICRRKVPIAVVITGLENQEGDMEFWWHNNKGQFSKLKMTFDSHACVTTLSESPCIDSALLQKRKTESKEAVTEMIISTCRSQRWRPPERSWFESAFADIRSMLTLKDGPVRHATIIMCEASQDHSPMRSPRKRAFSFHNPVMFSSWQVSFRKPVSISCDRHMLPFEDSLRCTSECVYRVYQVPRKQAPIEDSANEAKKVMVIKRGADLLIFCVEMHDPHAKSQWEHFNHTYGGDLSPQLVVVIGGLNQRHAEEWWTTTIGEVVIKDGIRITYWPPDKTAKTEADAARVQLGHLINDSCIDCSLKTMLVRNETLFRRSLVLDMSGFWTKAEGAGKEDGSSSSPAQDLLTQWGVWNRTSEVSFGLTSPVSLLSSRGTPGAF